MSFVDLSPDFLLFLLLIATDLIGAGVVVFILVVGTVVNSRLLTFGAVIMVVLLLLTRVVLAGIAGR